MFSKRWRQIYQQIIKRQAPHAILSWRYFMPKQSHAVKLHRRAFLQAWPQHPRLLWYLIAIYSYTLWFSFYSWRQTIAVWNRQSRKLHAEANISRAAQLVNLLALALLHTTPPQCYYQYRLYRYPEREWLNFIFTHELPHWHQLMSPNISTRSQHLMSNKDDFAREMALQGLPTIATAHVVRKGEAVPTAQLFSGQSLFIKPLQGSRKQDCYQLRYHAQHACYCLSGDGGAESCELAQIQATIDRVAQTRDLMLQPLLSNHPSWGAYSQSSPLFTLRVVTHVKHDEQPKVLVAALEIPLDESFTLVYAITIDVDKGTLTDMTHYYSAATLEWRQRFKQFAQMQVPEWPTVIATVEKAHQSFRDIASIGWDLAITPQGVSLLEGNINWGVAVHQRECGLISKLIGVY